MTTDEFNALPEIEQLRIENRDMGRMLAEPPESLLRIAELEAENERLKAFDIHKVVSDAVELHADKFRLTEPDLIVSFRARIAELEKALAEVCRDADQKSDKIDKLHDMYNGVLGQKEVAEKDRAVVIAQMNHMEQYKKQRDAAIAERDAMVSATKHQTEQLDTYQALIGKIQAIVHEFYGRDERLSDFDLLDLGVSLIANKYKQAIAERDHARLEKNTAIVELDAAERWESGFRNVVYALHGSRFPFDIPLIVEDVKSVIAERDGLRRAIEAAGHAYGCQIQSEPHCAHCRKVKDRHNWGDRWAADGTCKDSRGRPTQTTWTPLDPLPCNCLVRVLAAVPAPANMEKTPEGENSDHIVEVNKKVGPHVGSHSPRNVWDGDRQIAYASDEDQAVRIVAALKAEGNPVPLPSRERDDLSWLGKRPAPAPVERETQVDDRVTLVHDGYGRSEFRTDPAPATVDAVPGSLSGEGE